MRVIIRATGAKLAATHHRHPRRIVSIARGIIRRWRPAIIRLSDRYAALHVQAPERSAAAVNRLARKFRAAMRRATHRDELAARAAQWRDEAEARARRIHRSHDMAEEFRRARAGMETEAMKPTPSRGRGTAHTKALG